MAVGVKMLIVFVSVLVLLQNVWSLDVHRMSIEDDANFRSKIEVTKNVTFSFAKHFQDHMVLQQGPTRANIYGFAPEKDIGRKMGLQLLTPDDEFNYETLIQPGRVPGLGEWMVTLNAMDAGTVVSINAEIEGTAAPLTLRDVIFGDVWLCSGQSNMEFTVIQMFGAQDEIDDAHNYPDIRIMTVAQKESPTPTYDLIEIEQPWTKPDKDSVGGPAWKYFSAVCWLYGKAIYKARKYPIGLIATDWGGTPVEAWSSPDALATCGIHENTASKQPDSFRNYVDTLPPEERYRLEGPGNNSVLWNSMIYPFLNSTIYGAIWYQGEADASGEKMNRYNCTFPAMIKDWRVKFREASKGTTIESFPFGFVQLAADANRPVSTGFPDIRWHQTADFGYVPNKILNMVFMAVAMDLPDFNSTYGTVHPRDKKDVGERLALSGLAVAYGQTEMFQGPFPEHAVLSSEGFLDVEYGKTWTLDVRDTKGFEYYCYNGWQPTTIMKNSSTIVSLQYYNVCGMNITASALRYAWRESPCEFKKCAVYETQNNLPAPPFVMYRFGDRQGKPYFGFKDPTEI